MVSRSPNGAAFSGQTAVQLREIMAQKIFLERFHNWLGQPEGLGFQGFFGVQAVRNRVMKQPLVLLR